MINLMYHFSFFFVLFALEPSEEDLRPSQQHAADPRTPHYQLQEGGVPWDAKKSLSRCIDVEFLGKRLKTCGKPVETTSKKVIVAIFEATFGGSMFFCFVCGVL